MDFQFTTTFSSIIKPLVSEEKDKYLAMASLVDVGSFIPEINTEKNVDLLPVAFNACVINRANKNGDVIDTATALDIYKHFINKPINVEHNRQRIIGTILTAGFSEFGTDKPLTENQVKDMKAPFNMTLGGVIWKIVNPEIADKIEESSDEASEDYLSISASWELGFSKFNLAVSENDSKNLEDCAILDDTASMASLKDYLKANGGTGKSKDGKSVYRKVIGNVVPLGIGLTENPAAEVKGIAVKDEKSKDIVLDTDKSSENQENISQSSDLNVNKNSNKVMKINSLEDINEKNWKEISASAVTEFIAESLQKAGESYVTEKNKVENMLKETEATSKKLQDEYAGLKTSLEAVQGELSKLQQEKAAREQTDAFNARMEDVNSTYALNDDMAKVIADQLKNCMSEDDFSKYKSNMAVFLKPFERKASAATPSDDKQNKGPTEQTSDTKMKDKKDEAAYASATEVVDAAVENATKEKVSLPNSIETKKPSLYEQYSQAFSLEEGFVVNKNRR
jgi:hypothetical protein